MNIRVLQFRHESARIVTNPEPLKFVPIREIRGKTRSSKQLTTSPRTTLFAIFAAMITLTTQCLTAAESDFERDAVPILKEHCFNCHGPDESESKLRLDSMMAALIGGNTGEKTVVPGHSDQSYLIELITHKDPAKRMPPESDPLSEEHVNILRAWIDDAAAWKDTQQKVADRKTDHWSFQPLARPDVPPVDEAKNAIDAFVAGKLSDVGLRMSKPAERRRLIRRLFLVMHGLPPTPEQVEAFVNDSQPDAWKRLVEQVLASSQYGERWAQHWLDLVRFGETNGYETNRERPNAWPYRDWVIDAFNNDKPYDQFIIEQIAGDAVGDPIGTSFLVAGPVDIVKSQDPNLTMMQRQDELADMINTTSTAFLGLTVGCARCHNHKFDPISQTDYYAMQAVFAGVQHGDTALPLPEDAQQQVTMLDADIATLKQQLAKFVSKDAKRPAVNPKLNVEEFAAVPAKFVRFTINGTSSGQACIDELEVFSSNENVALASEGAKSSSSGDFVHPLHKLSQINDGIYGNPNSWISAQVKGGWVKIEFADVRKIDRIVWARDRQGNYGDRLAVDYRIDVSADDKAWSPVASSEDRESPDKESNAPDYDFAAFAPDEAEAGRALLTSLQGVTKQREVLAKPRMVHAGTFRQPGATHRLYRGEPASPREEVLPAGIASLEGVQLAADSAEQQRRIETARWIASAENPLTARVMVNRLWQFHFGTGIVDTPSDFGANGTKPTHPKLLDWLAAELIDSGWSLKHIHRLILMSATWQQDSQPQAAAMLVDASSRSLWRFPPRRLEAEGIRDCIVAVTGKLNSTMGGPGFSAFEVQLENVRHYFPKQDFGPGDWRRMVYQTKVRQERDAVFGVFDCPDGSSVTPKRSRSTTPLQALNLLNSRFVMQQAEFLAARLQRERADPAAKVVRAYELCFGRTATPDEISVALKFVDRADWLQFARAMLNANEFLFVP